ncbi:hypothetical protein FICKIIDM_00988 [Xanthomonas citri pv. punicae]|nr:hypothetical protein FICKIIDM_00988 [Xanthomonas citri pv. punicae]
MTKYEAMKKYENGELRLSPSPTGRGVGVRVRTRSAECVEALQ